MRHLPTVPFESSALPALVHLLEGYYHQDAWEDFSTNEEIWTFFVSNRDFPVTQLAWEVDLLLTRDAEAIHAFVQEHADALYSPSADGSKAWAETLKQWLSTLGAQEGSAE